MSAVLKQTSEVAVQKSGEKNIIPLVADGSTVNWQQELTLLCKQPIRANERLYWMLFMREKLFQVDQSQTQTTSGSVVGDYVSPGDSGTEPLTGDILEKMTRIAERLCDWPLVIYLREDRKFRLREKPGSLSSEPDYLENIWGLACAYRQQGMLYHAQQIIQTGLLVDYQQQLLERCYWQLQGELSNLAFDNTDLTADPLMLTPLNEQHLESFSWVYADPRIAQLCNLPVFESNEHWLGWLEYCQAESNKHLFAVNHKEWGFIGSVSLEVFNGVGFFYYWIGTDFQGHGFGPQAVDILLQLGANYLGLKCCYAKVYEDNLPSQKAMEKLGFEMLPFKVEPPYENEVLYYLGSNKPDRILYKELERLFIKQDSNTKLAGAVAWNMGLD